MFIDNKYTNCYNKIIENRRENPVVGYVEKHHIIPKSLGGNNKKENIVSLTAKEHFVCHRLLVKMTDGKDKMKMAYALRMLSRLENPYQNRYKITAKLYEKILKETKPLIGKYLTGELNPYYGKQHSVAVRSKMSTLRLTRVSEGAIEGMVGKHHTDITKDKLREANKKQFEDINQIELRRKKSKDLWADPLWRSKYKGNAGGKWFNNGVETKLIRDLSNIPAGWVPGRIFKKGGETNE
jgi:hypothetical protein